MSAMSDEAIKVIKAKRLLGKRWRADNRERLKTYYKKWREDNPEKVKEYQRRYYEKKAQEVKEKDVL